MSLIKWKYLLLTAKLSILPLLVPAQNAPVTLAATFGDAIPGSIITIPVTVSSFSNIGSVSLALDYNYSKIHFVSGIKNPLLPGSVSIGDNNLGNGVHRVMVGWYGSGLTLPDGSWIVKLDFTYLSGTSSLQWFDNGPSCSYADGDGNLLNDVPTSAYFINGLICGMIASPGMITGNTTVCRGESTNFYSIAPLENVSGYHWQVPPGALITSGWNTNGITVDFPAGSASGTIAVNGLNACGSGPASQLAITIYDSPFANAGNDTSILSQTSVQLHAASGGMGSYAYHWSPENLFIDPNLQDPQTVALAGTTIFYLTVTSLASQCQATDNIMVSTMGGPLTSNPTEIPGEICRGQSARLFSNAGGGSGNYVYSWTCIPPGTPPWSSDLATPLVMPDTSTLYNVIISDGPNQVSASVSLPVNELPSAVLSGGDTICDDGSAALIQIDLNGTPPWNFIYSNGLTTWFVNDQLSSLYSTFTNDEGIYSIISVDNSTCPGQSSGTAEVVLLPPFSSPSIIFESATLISSEPFGNQWYLNMNPIPGANGQIFHPEQSGSYFVICSNSACTSDTSNIIDVIINTINQNEMNLFTIYPNPVRDYFMVRFDDFVKGDFILNICSAEGMCERVMNLNSNGNQHECKINVDGLKAGVHFLLLNDRYGTYVQKLVVY